MIAASKAAIIKITLSKVSHFPEYHNPRWPQKISSSYLLIIKTSILTQKSSIHIISYPFIYLYISSFHAYIATDPSLLGFAQPQPQLQRHGRSLGRPSEATQLRPQSSQQGEERPTAVPRGSPRSHGRDSGILQLPKARAVSCCEMTAHFRIVHVSDCFLTGVFAAHTVPSNIT